MKKSLVLLLVIALLLPMVACSSKEKAEKYCWNCGEGISIEVSFCGYCGAPVTDNSSKITTGPAETTTSPDSMVTTAPSNEETQASAQPTETQKPAPPQKPNHTHSYSEKTTDATCTGKGYTTYTCSCGDTYTDNQTAATGHSWGNWTTVSAAEVGKAGQEKRTCSSCAKTETRRIPALQEDLTKKWFIAQYAVAKQQYIDGLSKDITVKQDQIDDVEKDIKILDDNYAQEVIDIHKKYAGGSSSTAAQRRLELENAKANYKSSLKVYTDKVTALENEISAIEAEISNPNADKILTICAQNNNISSKEIYEYYYKYYDSLS